MVAKGKDNKYKVINEDNDRAIISYNILSCHIVSYHTTFHIPYNISYHVIYHIISHHM